VHSVVHTIRRASSRSASPGTKIRPLLHTCACMGHEVPIWDSGDKFGDTNMLVSSIEMGRDLARRVGDGRTALLRGHGSVVTAKAIREVVYISVYLEVERAAADAGDGDGHHQVPHRRRGRQDSCHPPVPFAFDRAWEKLVPPRRPSRGRDVGGVTLLRHSGAPAEGGASPESRQSKSVCRDYGFRTAAHASRL